MLDWGKSTTSTAALVKGEPADIKAVRMSLRRPSSAPARPTVSVEDDIDNLLGKCLRPHQRAPQPPLDARQEGSVAPRRLARRGGVRRRSPPPRTPPPRAPPPVPMPPLRLGQEEAKGKGSTPRPPVGRTRVRSKVRKDIRAIEKSLPGCVEAEAFTWASRPPREPLRQGSLSSSSSSSSSSCLPC